MKSMVPNGLTLLNLFFGCVAIFYLFEHQPIVVFWCLVISNVADFLDGWAARALGVSGDLGKELDSLADMISFGLVPGFMLFFLLQQSCDYYPYGICQWSYLPFIAFVVTLSSAFRLAKFNLMESDKRGFIGLPTPANTIFILGFYMLIHSGHDSIRAILIHPASIISVVLIFSYLLNSPFTMFKLQMTIKRWKENIRQWILLLVAVPSLIFLREGGLAVIVFAYILLSLSQTFQSGKS